MKTAHQNVPTPQANVDAANKSYVDTAVGGASMAIGSTVTGGTAGSLLFVNTGPILAQNNTRLFWDNTNARLGIGTNLPGSTLDLVGASNTAAMSFFGGSAAGVGVAGTGRLRFNESTNQFQVSLNGAAYADVLTGTAGTAIGSTVTGGTAGSLLFVGSGPVLAQDNANLFWDATNFRLGIGMNAPTTTLDLFTTGSATAVAFAAGSSAGVSAAGKGRIRYNESTTKFQVSVNGGAYADVATGSVSLAIGTSIGGATSGSILFADSGPSLAQDNTNFFWDNTNKRLGIGSASPTVTLDVRGSNNVTDVMYLRNTNVGGYSAVSFWDNTGVIAGATGYGNASANDTTVASRLYWRTFTSDMIFSSGAATPSTPQLFLKNSNGFLGIGTVTPGAKLDVSSTTQTLIRVVGDSDNSGADAAYTGYVISRGTGPSELWFIGRDGTTPSDDLIFRQTGTSNVAKLYAAGGLELTASTATVSAASTGKWRYNSTSQRIEASFNAGSYFEIARNAASLTTGSIPFADANGNLAQNNADLNWDNTNNTLNVSGGNSTHFALDIHGLDTSGNQNTVRIANNAGSFGVPVLQFDHASTFVGGIAGYSSAPAFGLFKGITIALPSGFAFGVRQGAASLSGDIAQFDSANTYLNATNTSIGHQNTSAYTLDVRGSISASAMARISNTNAAGYSSIDVFDSSNAQQGSIGYANASTAFAHITGLNYWYTTGPDMALVTATVRNHRFGNGTGTAFHEMANGSSSAVSAANNGRLIYTTTGQKFQISANGAAYLDVALMAAALTTGSVPFADASGHLAQDNTNLFWDNTNKRLGVGTNAPIWPLHVKTTAASVTLARLETATTSSCPGVEFTGPSGVTFGIVGYGNSAIGIANARGHNFLYANQVAASADWVICTDTVNNFWFGMAVNNIFLEQTNGGSSAVSSANTGRLIYNTTGQKYQVSANGAAYLDVALMAAALTTGSVPFSDSSGHLAQDNTNLFWDNTNKRLGIGTSGPSYPLEVRGSIADLNLQLYNTSSSGYAGARLVDSGGTFKGYVAYANAGVSLSLVNSLLVLYSGGPDWVITDGTVLEHRFGVTSGSAFYQQANGSSAAVSSSNTGRLIYTTTGQKFQVSANGAAYLDVALLAAPLTTGSIPFADSSGHLAQNNSKFFWDNTNFRLGIRTTSPAHALDVQGGNINLKTHTGYTGSDVVTSTFAVQTTTATTLDTTIFTMADQTVFRVIYDVIGRDEAGAERALLGRAALVYRQGGGATIQTENTTFNDIHTNPGMNAAVTVSTNDVRISITGLAATTIDWVVHMRYQALATSA